MPLCDEIGKLREFHTEKYEAKKEACRHPECGLVRALVVRGEHSKPHGETARKQEHCLDEHKGEREKLLCARSSKSMRMQNSVGGKECGKNETVAHQVHPESKSHRLFEVLG